MATQKRQWLAYTARLMIFGFAMRSVAAFACNSQPQFEPDTTTQATLTVSGKEKCTLFIITNLNENYADLAAVILKQPLYGIATLKSPTGHTVSYQAVRRITDQDAFTVRALIKLDSGKILVNDLVFTVKQE